MSEKNEYRPNEAEQALIDRIQAEIDELLARKKALLRGDGARVRRAIALIAGRDCLGREERKRTPTEPGYSRMHALQGNWQWDGARFVRQT